MKNAIILLLCVMALASCRSMPVSEMASSKPAPAVSEQHTPLAHDNVNAVLFMQSAAEYQATTRTLFQLASHQLGRLLGDTRSQALPKHEWQALGIPSSAALPPAVIVDLDETMLDNSPYQARMIRDGQGFNPATWSAWVQEQRAQAIAGASAFVNDATARGIHVFYISNRSHDDRDATVANLKALGWPTGEADSRVLLQGDPRAADKEKASRRAWVAKNHRVLMLLGDNLGDFIDGASKDAAGQRLSLAARKQLIDTYAAHWGRDWIMFPNPTYGSWESAVRGACAKDDAVEACKRAALRFH